jgi:hypothetical protein
MVGGGKGLTLVDKIVLQVIVLGNPKGAIQTFDIGFVGIAV